MVIIPGKGLAQLKKRVLRFLDRKGIKTLYYRVERDSDNFGRSSSTSAGSGPLDPGGVPQHGRAPPRSELAI